MICAVPSLNEGRNCEPRVPKITTPESTSARRIPRMGMGWAMLNRMAEAAAPFSFRTSQPSSVCLAVNDPPSR